MLARKRRISDNISRPLFFLIQGCRKRNHCKPMIINKMYRSKSQINDKVSEIMDTVGLADRFVNSYPHELDGGAARGLVSPELCRSTRILLFVTNRYPLWMYQFRRKFLTCSWTCKVKRDLRMCLSHMTFQL